MIRRVFRSPTAVIAALASAPAYAAGSNMPWEQPLQQILDSVRGSWR
jgi:type IV secretion system protein TrbC